MRIAPDAGAVLGDRQIEARRRQRDLLGAGLDERKVESELALASARRRELSRRHVDADGTGSASGQPRRNVRGAAAEFDDVEVTDFTEGAQRCLRDTEDSPGDFRRRPAVACLLVRVVGVGLRPAFSVAPCVVGDFVHHVPASTTLSQAAVPNDMQSRLFTLPPFVERLRLWVECSLPAAPFGADGRGLDGSDRAVECGLPHGAKSPAAAMGSGDGLPEFRAWTDDYVNILALHRLSRVDRNLRCGASVSVRLANG